MRTSAKLTLTAIMLSIVIGMLGFAIGEKYGRYSERADMAEKAAGVLRKQADKLFRF